jgi:sucrose-6-phosphate hydrolase SacC (GH32 family)
MIGWMSNWQYADKLPTNPWRGQMTVPRSLALAALPEGIRLVQKPVPAIANLRDKHFEWRGTSSAELNRALKTAHFDSFELQTTVAHAAGATIGWKLLAGHGAFTEVGYDGARHELSVDRTHSGVTGFSHYFPVRTVAPLTTGDNPLSMTILVDRSTIEVFAQGGRVAMTNLAYPPSGAQAIEFYSRGEQPGEITVDLWSLRSTWAQK